MRRKAAQAIHPFDCDCTRCMSGHRPRRSFGNAARHATRALFLIAVLLAIPFVIARTLANALGDQR